MRVRERIRSGEKEGTWPYIVKLEGCTSCGRYVAVAEKVYVHANILICGASAAVNRITETMACRTSCMLTDRAGRFGRIYRCAGQEAERIGEFAHDKVLARGWPGT